MNLLGVPWQVHATVVPVHDGVSTTVTVMGVKLNEWNYQLPEDDFAIEQASFRAPWIKVEDASG